MTLAAEIAASLNGLDGLWLPAVDALTKVTLVLGIAGLAALVLGRASAAARHLVWTVALTSALVLPLLSIALPRWQLPIVTLTNDAAMAPATEPTPIAPPFSRRVPSTAAANETPSSAGAAPSTATIIESSPALPRVAATTMIVGIWLMGVALVLGRLLLGIVAVTWMSRRTARVVDAPWLPLAKELAGSLGVHRVRFLQSARASMPMASGIFTPSVLMPEDANRWPLERLRIVLLHELAHVKRRDCLTHVIAQLACALHWFNPLAWMAARRIRKERERACDDLVLATGTRGPDYAEELLEIARVMSSGRYPAILAGATLAMAHRTELEGRLIAILDPRVPRAGMTPAKVALTAVAVACMLPPLAAMQPWTVADAAVPEPAASQQVAQLPSPAPEAQLPQPEPQPQPSTSVRSVTIAQPEPELSIATALTTTVQTEAVARGEGVGHATVQGVATAASRASLDVIVGGAVEGTLQALSQAGQTTQEGKRAGADPRMVAALTAALKDTDKEVRENAMHALVQLRDPAIFEPLVQALKDTSPDVREQAAHGLAQLRDKRAVEPLIGALKDSNASVRESALQALSQLRDPRAIDGFQAALKDENADVREKAAFALGQVRDARSVEPLIAALKDPNANVREQAAFALGQLRDKRASAALAASVKDTDPDVREQAVFALGQLRDVSAIDGLTSALRDTKPDVRQQAAFALGQIRDPRSVSPLISALKDEAPDVRQQAAFALGQIRDRSAVEALVVAVKDSDADVREQVVFALGQLRDPRAMDALMLALKDASADVRQQAAFALGQIAR